MDSSSSPQHLAVGEVHKVENNAPNEIKKQSYASTILAKQSVPTNLELFPVVVNQGEPVIQFTKDEVNNFIKEEGLHQAVIIEFSYGRPDLSEVRRIFSSQFDVQGHCNIGHLEYLHLLVRFDLHNDYVQFLSKSTAYLKSNRDEYFFRTFPWSLEFNAKEETPMAVVWISFPGLPPNFFAKRSLMSIAAAVGKPLAVDKATHERSRPSTARVKVIINLLDNHPKKIKLQIFDRITGKTVEFYQQIVIDNLPKYCSYCKHQGHDIKMCRIKKENIVAEVVSEEQLVCDLAVLDGQGVVEKGKLKGDARDFLNAKRAAQAIKEAQGKVDNVGDGLTKSSLQNVQIAEGLKELNNQVPVINAKERELSSLKSSDDAVSNEVQHTGNSVSLEMLNMADFELLKSHSTHEQGTVSGVKSDMAQQISKSLGDIDEARLIQLNDPAIITTVLSKSVDNLATTPVSKDCVIAGSDERKQMNVNASACQIAPTTENSCDDESALSNNKSETDKDKLRITNVREVAMLDGNNPIETEVKANLDNAHMKTMNFTKENSTILLKDAVGLSEIPAQTVFGTDVSKKFVLNPADDTENDRECSKSKTTVENDFSDPKIGTVRAQYIEESLKLDKRDALVHSDLPVANHVFSMSGQLEGLQLNFNEMDVAAQVKYVHNLEHTEAVRNPAAGNSKRRDNLELNMPSYQYSSNLPMAPEIEQHMHSTKEDVKHQCDVMEFEIEASLSKIKKKPSLDAQSEAIDPNISDDRQSNHQISPVVDQNCTDVNVSTVHKTELLQAEGNQQGNEVRRSQHTQENQLREESGEITDKEKWSSTSNKNRSPKSKIQQLNDQKTTDESVSKQEDMPSVSNSFDVLANVDDDERNNMGLKSCRSQTSSQKSESKIATLAKDTFLQTRSIFKSTSDHKAPKRAKSSKPKLWKDQGDYDDDETWGETLASFSWEEEDQVSGEDSEDSIEQKIERKIANKNSRAKANQTSTSKRRLNHNAPVYVPAINVKADRSFEGTSTVKINDRHLNSTEKSVDDRFATQQPSSSIHTNQKLPFDVNTEDMSQAKQLVTANPIIPSVDKQSLEVLVNTETNITGVSVLNSQELPKISCAGTHI